MTALHAQGLLTLRFAYHLFTQKPKEELHDFRTWTTMTRTRSGCSGGCMRSTPCPCSPRGISICIIWGSTGEERGGQSRLPMLHKAQKCLTGTLPTQQSGARWGKSRGSAARKSDHGENGPERGRPYAK